MRGAGLLHRLRVVRAAMLGCLIAAAVAPQALAQANYPTKPIRIMVGFAAGGPADIIARVVGGKLGELLGQQVVIENRAGAGGTLATDAVARSDADGYTLLMTPLANAVNETLFKTMRAKVGEQLMAVAPLAETANVLVVHPSLDVKSVSDLIALAKSKPGDILYASAGRGTATHLTSELFCMMAGVKLTPVQYRGGGEAAKDLLSGQVKVMFSSIAPVLEHVKSGSLRGIATTGPKRDAALPDLPTVAESGLPGFDVRLWIGLLAPSGTPRPVIERLSGALTQALAIPEMKNALAAQGFDPLIGTPEQFDTFYRGEVEKWAKVIQAVGLTAE